MMDYSMRSVFVVGIILSQLSLLLFDGQHHVVVVAQAAAEEEEAQSSTHASTRLPSSSSPPHILFVLIDDLGWGDVGFHHDPSKGNEHRRREVQTPFMDHLAKVEGLELNRHYVHSSCTGTRTSLQSGRFPVHVQTSLRNPEDPASGMPRNLTGLAEHMHGYKKHYVGKWDVGMATPKHTPKGRGYDSSLNYFEHKNDYWTQECLQSVCCNIWKHKDNDPNGDINNDADNYSDSKEGQQNNRVFNESRVTTAAAANNNKNNNNKNKKHEHSKVYDLWDTDRPARHLVGTDYEELIFQRHLLNLIDQHAAASDNDDSPLFLFYAPHVAHCPLQVPQRYLDEFSFMDAHGDDEDICKTQTWNITGNDSKNNKTKTVFSCRKQYHAMVKLLDDVLQSLVARFKAHGDMWNSTLMVVTSDNGGPVGPDESGATNYPLRGGKYSDWEGGVRATAFVSGGYIPPNRRGNVVRDPIHICDWYATLPALAGIDVTKQQEDERTDKNIATGENNSGNNGNLSSIPPVDAVNVWPLITAENDDHSSVGRHQSRKEIPLSRNAIIVGDYKLIWNENKNISESGWTTRDYPNSHTGRRGILDDSVDCSVGCLFNVETDPGEHHNLAASNPLLLSAMKERLRVARRGFFENNDRGIDSCPDGYNNNNSKLPCACWMAVNYYGGFLGPYQEVNLGNFMRQDEETK